jgi:hypothetical protein
MKEGLLGGTLRRVNPRERDVGWMSVWSTTPGEFVERRAGPDHHPPGVSGSESESGILKNRLNGSRLQG